MYKTIIIAALASLAAATPTPGYGHGHGEPASQCNVGKLQCCDNVAKAGDPKAQHELALVGAIVQDVNVPIGLQCDPITVIGVSGTSCAAQPVCCEDNNFNGVVAIGCTPVDVNV